MLARHRVLSALMVSALAVFSGCGGSSDNTVGDENDSGDETSTEAGGDETIVDTGTGDDTGTTDDTGTGSDTGTTDTGTAMDSTIGDTGSGGDTGTAGDTGSGGDTSSGGDTGSSGDTGSAGDTSTGGDTGSASDTGTGVDTGPEVVATGSCTAVSITTAGYTDTHVRQGAGNIAIKITGTGLAGTTSVSFGSVVCTAITASATQVTATCNIPHGATLGATNIILDAGAIATCTAGATVDKITVDAATGSDTNVGSATKPYKSVKQGLSVAASGDTVDIKAGTYSTTATGETWVTTAGTTPYGAGTNVKAGVTIEGDAAGGTKLVGTGVGPASSTQTALVLAGGATISNLSLDSFRWGVAAFTGKVSLTDVSITNSVKDGVIGQSGASGNLDITLSSATAGSGATLSKCLLQGNDVGFRFGGASTTATLTNCDVVSNGSAGGLSANDASLTTTTVRFQKNGVATSPGITTGLGTFRGGLGFEGTAGKLTMTGGEITDSYDFGLGNYGPNAIKLTNLIVQKNGAGAGSAPNAGATFTTAAGSASFGTLDITGGDFSSNGLDGLSVNQGFDVTITGTSFKTNGTVPVGIGGGVGLRFGATGTISAKGITVTGNPNEQITISDGASAATKIEFLDNGSTPTTIARTTASTTTALVRDNRAPTAGGGTIIQFAKATIFQTATMPSNTYTAPPNDVFDKTPATSLVFHISSTGRKIQVL